MKQETFIDVSDKLVTQPIVASAPCRVDLGGVWDTKAVALVGRQFNPLTVNIALNLRAQVTLRSWLPGRVKVSSEGFRDEESNLITAPFHTPLGLIFAIHHFFGITGVHTHITTSFPPMSGLGGSGVIAVALINAIMKVLHTTQIETKLSLREIVELAHEIEDGLRLSFTGLQDQAAAAFGGAHIWAWHYENRSILLSKTSIWSAKQLRAANKHILVAYTGEQHNSVGIHQNCLSSFLDGQNRSKWIELNELTREFGVALQQCNWLLASDIMKRELKIRQILIPEILSSRAEKLVDIANQYCCGARFAGAGGGGCIWAIGEEMSIRSLSTAWKELICTMPNANILHAEIAHHGVD